MEEEKTLQLLEAKSEKASSRMNSQVHVIDDPASYKSLKEYDWYLVVITDETKRCFLVSLKSPLEENKDDLPILKEIVDSISSKSEKYNTKPIKMGHLRVTFEVNVNFKCY